MRVIGTTGKSPISQYTPQTYAFATGISYLRHAFGDAGLTHDDLEQLYEMLLIGKKYRPYRRLYTEIYNRLKRDGHFKLPTNITETTATELNLKGLV